ncbi:MAG: TolC family protein [Cyanothece sp. SIO1E1]|nr:TolC family protein [Cyanothece sp. SIO1E1]
MLRKLLPIVLMASLSLTAQSQSSSPMSLDDAIKYALNQSNAVKDARINLVDAEQQIVERRSVGLPQLTGNLNYQRYLKLPIQPLPANFQVFGAAFTDLAPFLSEETLALLNQGGGEGNSDGVSFFLRNNFNATLNLDAMIFDGSYFVGLQAAKAYRAYVSQDLLTKEREVRNSTIDAYLPVLVLQENMGLIDKNIANLEKLLFETQELYKAGFAEQLDVDRLQLSLVNLETQKETLQRQKSLALNGLKFAMQYPLEESLEVTGDLNEIIAENTSDIVAEDLVVTNRPEIGLLEQGIKLNELNVRLQRSGYLPTLRAFAVAQESFQGNTFSDGFWAPTIYVGASLSIPIFDGLYKQATIQRAKLDVEQARLQKDNLQRGINLEITNARTSYENATELLASQERNMALAQRIYETTQIKYREGVGSSLEVSQAEQSLYSTQSNYIQAQYDLVQAIMNVKKALGKI